MALMIAGGISLFGNLGLAVFGYVDEFVTPLSAETQSAQGLRGRHNGRGTPGLPARPGAVRLDSPRATIVMTLVPC